MPLLRTPHSLLVVPRLFAALIAGCSVVVEGSGQPAENAAIAGGDAATPWVASSGGLQGGSGGAEGGGATTGGGAGAGGAAAGGPVGAPPIVVEAGPGPNAPPTSIQCPLDGVFAFRFALGVLWQGTDVDITITTVPVIDRGEGQLDLVLLGRMSPTREGAEFTARVCGVEVPSFFSSLVGERYAADFDDQIWASTNMPRFSFDLAASCREPGARCRLESTRIHAQLGAKLDDPAGQWPSSAAAAPLWPDHDGDLEPGITAQLLGPESQDELDMPYSHPPVAFLRRINKMMLGLRMQVLMELELLECNELQGHTLEARVDSRALSCVVDTPPYECSAEELSFLDSNLPFWAVREGMIRGVRMEADADCAAARAAFR